MNLTVVMSVLNGGPFVRSAVESILTQTYKDFVFLICDNGSTDKTGDILDEYARQDRRVRIIHKSVTVHLSEARNELIGMAMTEWVGLMNADDVSEPDRLAKQICFVSQYNDRLGVLGTWAHYINADDKKVGRCTLGPVTLEQFERSFAKKEPIVLVDPSSLIHRPTFLRIGGYRKDTDPPQDLDLWYRIAEHGRALLVLPEFLLRFRIHQTSVSAQKTMLARQKIHFVNYNMRRRRGGREEISWDAFKSQVWASLRYRLPRLHSDLAMLLYKRAGLYYCAGRRSKMVGNLVVAGCLKPSFVFRRLICQKTPFIR